MPIVTIQVIVIIEEVDTDNWGWGGLPASNIGESGLQRPSDDPVPLSVTHMHQSGQVTVARKLPETAR